MKKHTIILLISVFLCSCWAAIPKNNFEYPSFSINTKNVYDSLYVQTVDTDTSATSTLCQKKGSKVDILYTIPCMDGSSIDFVNRYDENGVIIYDCYAIYNAAADGNKFLFFSYVDGKVYITTALFSGFYPRTNSVDFVKLELILQNTYPLKSDAKEVVDIGSDTTYITYTNEIKTIKAKLYEQTILEK